MKNEQSETTLTTLANGAELVAAIAAEVLGSALSSSVNGAEMNNRAVHSLAASVFQSEMLDCMKGLPNAVN